MKCLQSVVFLSGFICVYTQFYQTNVHVTAQRWECQPPRSIDQLATWNGIVSLIKCASKCNQQPLCRYFDYDSSIRSCRTFMDCSIVVSSSSTSKVGSVRYATDLYSSYGQPCTWDTCQANRYLTCNIGNRCQCPAGLIWSSQICAVNNFSYNWLSTGITVAGTTGSPGVSANQLHHPAGVIVDASNTLYIVDTGNNRIQRYLPGTLNGTTVAGQSNGAAGSGLSDLRGPVDMVIDSNGSIYIADTLNHRVFYWNNGSSAGDMIAGNGTFGSANNQLDQPHAIALDPNTRILYISDTFNHRVMQYSPGATSGSVVIGGQGPGTNSTQLNHPRGLYFDSLTNSLLIANAGGNNIIRWVVGALSWTLVVGSGSGLPGNTSLLLYWPTHVVLDSIGNMYVSDEVNQRIQFFPSGQSNGTTIAGLTGVAGNSSSLFNTPCTLAVDSQFNVYVGDCNNDRVQKFPHY